MSKTDCKTNPPSVLFLHASPHVCSYWQSIQFCFAVLWLLNMGIFSKWSLTICLEKVYMKNAKKPSSGKHKVWMQVLEHSCKNAHSDCKAILLPHVVISLVLRTHYNNLLDLAIQEHQPNKKRHFHSLIFSHTLSLWKTFGECTAQKYLSNSSMMRDVSIPWLTSSFVCPLHPSGAHIVGLAEKGFHGFLTGKQLYFRGFQRQAQKPKLSFKTVFLTHAQFNSCVSAETPDSKT